VYTSVTISTMDIYVFQTEVLRVSIMQSSRLFNNYAFLVQLF